MKDTQKKETLTLNKKNGNIINVLSGLVYSVLIITSLGICVPRLAEATAEYQNIGDTVSTPIGGSDFLFPPSSYVFSFIPTQNFNLLELGLYSQSCATQTNLGDWTGSCIRNNTITVGTSTDYGNDQSSMFIMTAQSTTTAGLIRYQHTASSTIPLTAGTTYYVYISNNSVNKSQYYGTSLTQTGQFGKWVATLSGNQTANTFNTLGIKQIQYYISSTAGYNPPPPVTDTTTRIEAIAPANNSTSTTSVTFTWKYYVNSSTNNSSSTQPSTFVIYYWGFPLANVNKILVPITNLVLDQETTVSTTTTLVDNRNYGYYINMNAVTVPEGCNSVNLASVYCAFAQANQGLSQIATTPTIRFFLGTNPYTDTNTLFNAVVNDYAGTGNFQLTGQCTLVATSTCDGASPSTYPGCLFNAGVALLCPSQSVIDYATSTTMETLNNKLPFALYYKLIQPIEDITNSTTTSKGDDVTLHLGSDSLGDLKIFQWQGAHDFLNDTIGQGVMDKLYWIFAVTMTFVLIWLIIKFT